MFIELAGCNSKEATGESSVFDVSAAVIKLRF